MDQFEKNRFDSRGYNARLNHAIYRHATIVFTARTHGVRDDRGDKTRTHQIEARLQNANVTFDTAHDHIPSVQPRKLIAHGLNAGREFELFVITHGLRRQSGGQFWHSDAQALAVLLRHKDRQSKRVRAVD